MLQSVTEYNRVLQSVTGCYRVLQSVTECYRVKQSVTQYYRVFLAHLLGPIFGLVSNEFLVSGDGNCLFLLADCEGQLNKKKYDTHSY